MRYVFDFDEDSGGGRELLGGKGIGLAEMTQLGIPVPAGFTVTTDACRAYMAAGGTVPDGLDVEVEKHIASLEDRQASASETRPTRSSSRCAPERPSRCRG